MRLLVVEDQERLGEHLKDGLAAQAYDVTWVRTCFEARNALCEHNFAAIVLDLGLPDGDGLDLLKEWRTSGFDEPVLILSARDATVDRVKGLNGGADDYLSKPFSFEELLARLRSLLRRQSAVKTAILEHRGIVLDTVIHTVAIEGDEIELPSREFALLEIFMQNPGRVVTRSMICEAIWSSTFSSDANLLDVYMSRLRTKMDNVRRQPTFKTIRGVGYLLI